MKHIKKFNNLNSLNNYKNTEYYTRPNVSLEIQNKQLSYEQRYKNIEYIDNPNVDLNYQMYINKNFHFISTHQYRIQCKLQYISNKSDLYRKADYIYVDNDFSEEILEDEYIIINL